MAVGPSAHITGAMPSSLIAVGGAQIPALFAAQALKGATAPSFSIGYMCDSERMGLHKSRIIFLP